MAEINVAEGKKRSQILASEAFQQEQVNKASGDAEAIKLRADARAKGIMMVSEALKQSGGSDAAALSVAEQYVNAFKKLAKKTNTMILPASPGNPASMVAQALTIYKDMMVEKKPETPDEK